MPTPTELAAQLRDPEALRQTVLLEHAAIRRLLKVVSSLTDQLSAGAAGANIQVRSRLLEMSALMTAHFELEELVFPGLLEKTQPTEAARHVEHIRTEHEHQRRVMHNLAAQVIDHTIPQAALVETARSFVRDVLEDMREEEKTFLAVASVSDSKEAVAPPRSSGG